MMPARLRYPEKHVQQPAIGWLKVHWGYTERDDDVEAKGERMDSAGKIGDRVYVIEVKSKIPANTVEHAEDRPGNLESKISGALRQIYSRKSGKIPTAVNYLWDRQQPLVVVFLAERVLDDARDAIKKMIGRRSQTWAFDFRLWIWDGNSVVEEMCCDSGLCRDPLWYQTIEIEELKTKSQRLPPRSLEEFRARAMESKVEHLLLVVEDEAKRCGYSLVPGRDAVSLQLVRPGTKKAIPMISFYLNGKPTNGRLLFGCDDKTLKVDASTFAGAVVDGDVPGYVVHRDTKLYLSSPDDVRKLLRLFAESGGRGRAP